MNYLDLNLIKRQTRLALPDDNGYLFRLGVALYGFASLSSFMVEIACLLADKLDDAESGASIERRNQTELSGQMGGTILDYYRQVLKPAKKKYPAIKAAGQAAADLFEKLNTERSDFVHSYPITNKLNAQILHRRLDGKAKNFEVTNEFLDSFISRLAEVSSNLYEVRTILQKI